MGDGKVIEPELAGDLTPYPYTTPVPPDEPTAIDGEYVRTITVEEAGGPAVPCRRCAPYRLDAGRARFVFVRGTYTIEHKETLWGSVGHYFVSGDEVTLINDPNCPQIEGVYRFHKAGGELVFEVVDDPCAMGLRRRELTYKPWPEIVSMAIP